MCGRLEWSCAHDKIKNQKRKRRKKRKYHGCASRFVAGHGSYQPVLPVSRVFFVEYFFRGIQRLFLYDNCSKEQISISKARKRLNHSSKIFVVFLLLTCDFMKLCFHSFISQILRLFLTKVSWKFRFIDKTSPRVF